MRADGRNGPGIRTVPSVAVPSPQSRLKRHGALSGSVSARLLMLSGERQMICVRQTAIAGKVEDIAKRMPCRTSVGQGPVSLNDFG